MAKSFYQYKELQAADSDGESRKMFASHQVSNRLSPHNSSNHRGSPPFGAAGNPADVKNDGASAVLKSEVSQKTVS